MDETEFGVLLGWTSDPAGRRIAIKLQSATRVPDNREDVREYRYFMTREQAVQLADNLYRLADTTPPRPVPGLLRRLLS